MTEVFIFGSMTKPKKDNQSIYYPGFLSNILGSAVPRQTSFFASPTVGSASNLKDFVELVHSPQSVTLVEGYTTVSKQAIIPTISEALYYQE